MQQQSGNDKPETFAVAQETYIQKEDLDEEDAETHNINALDQKAKDKRAWFAETRMKEQVSVDPLLMTHNKPQSERFKNIARRARLMSRQVSDQRIGNVRHNKYTKASQNDIHNPSVAQDLLKTIPSKSSLYMQLRENNPLYASIGLFDDVTEVGDDNDNDDEHDLKFSTSHDTDYSENTDSLPLLSSNVLYGSVPAHEVRKRFNRSVKKKNSFKHRMTNKLRLWNCESFRMFLFNNIICSLLVLVAIPMFLLAIIFYYCLGNPIISFLNPTGTKVTVSWWLNFLSRQIVTFELARITQWIIVDCIVMSRRLSRLLGPYITLLALHSRGFPFIFSSWAILDMILLRGTSRFHNHWLYWTSWSIYSKGISGSFILSSDLYFRILMAMVFIGFATTIKRVAVAIRFGKRLLAEFKPRMEQLLADIVLMNEISILAEQVQAASDDYDHRPITSQSTSSATISPSTGSTPLLNSPGINEEDIAWSNVSTDKPSAIARGESTAAHAHTSDTSVAQRLRAKSDLSQQSSIGILVDKALLDQWEDPVAAMNKKTLEPTIHDVLRFKRALGYMDESHPFGAAYGPAGDRDEAIKSAHNVFFQLTKGDDVDSPRLLDFKVLALIASDENGKQIPAKLQALKNLFRPDCRNELPLLAFVQSCDNVYKRLRFFRASVSNSSALDEVLENILNCIFGFILSLMILEILQFDPWTVLVSATSLLVSFAFALGPSVSGFVEGILLIAGRRPFDLGDRILIIGSDSTEKPSPTESYFVEDISLLKTTIRYARTNEVSTLNNFAISKSRIVNLQRSVNAIVYLEMKFSIQDVFSNDEHLKYRSKLEEYVHENTRNWECLVFMRHDEFDADWGFVVFRFGFRHRYSWQNAARIMLNKADLLRFMYDKGEELGIHYSTPIPRRTVYDGGIIENNTIVHPRTTGIHLPLFTHEGK